MTHLQIMTDETVHRYRRLIVNDVPADRFIQLRYRVTPAAHLDLHSTAIRLLLILSQRTLMPLGFEDVRLSDTDKIGAVMVPSGPLGDGNIVIALPTHVVSQTEGLTQLVLTGASAAEYNYTSEVWLSDVVLPPSVMSWFAGPRLGVEGIRERLGVRDRPLLGYIVKSRTRASLPTVLQSCREALIGGADLLVDDLLSTDPDGELAFNMRVPALAALVDEFNTSRVRGQSRVGYIVNVGASNRRAEQYVARAREVKAFGCMVSCFTMGFGNVHELVELIHADEGEPLAVFATNMGSGMMGRNPDEERLVKPLSDRRFLRTGISEALTAKWARLAGADGVHTGSSGTECFEVAEYAQTHRALRASSDGLRECFAIAEGDMQLEHVAENVLDMGIDVVVETASGMANHPHGVAKGARAFRLFAECMTTEDFTKDDIDNVLNVLRHSYPEEIAPLLQAWKQQHDERIRAGWSAETSRKALERRGLASTLGAAEAYSR